MAYTEVAGLAAVAGLNTLLLPAVADTLLASSRQLVVGPGRVLGKRPRRVRALGCTPKVTLQLSGE